MATKVEKDKSDHELLHGLMAEVARLERELNEEARPDWKAKQAAHYTLCREGILVSPEQTSGRTLRAPGKPSGRKLIAEELEVAKAEAAERSLQAARRVQALAEKVRRARAALAQHELPDLATRHAATADAVATATRRAEQAYIGLVAALIEQGEALSAEKLAARAVVQVAVSPLTDGDERETLRRRAEHELPVALADDGSAVEWVERPESGLWALSGVSWVGGNDAFGEQLVDLVRAGRDRLRGACGSERVAETVIKALNERN